MTVKAGKKLEFGKSIAATLSNHDTYMRRGLSARNRHSNSSHMTLVQPQRYKVWRTADAFIVLDVVVPRFHVKL